MCRHFHPTYFICIYFTPPVSITNQFCSLTYSQLPQQNSRAQPSQKKREGEGKPVITDTLIFLVSPILSYLFFSKFFNKHISFFPIKHRVSLKCTLRQWCPDFRILQTRTILMKILRTNTG